MKEQFGEWLKKQNYTELTPNGAPSTIYNYQISIHGICSEENITWEALAENIANILPKYDIGGVKEAYGKKSNSTAINALKRFSEFLRSDAVQLPESVNDNEILKSTVLELLKTLSSGGFRVEYGELSDEILKNYGLNVNPHFGFTKILDKINDICINLNLPLITVMVVEQKSQKPSEGFFKYTRSITTNHPNYNYKYLGNNEFILKKAREYVRNCKDEDWDKLRIHLGIEPVISQEMTLNIDPPYSWHLNFSKDKIYNFAERFFEYLIQETGNNVFTQQKNVLAKGKFSKGIKLFGSTYLEFYETWGDKAAYLILYHGTEPVFELQLSRILFNDNNTITWYLRIPSAKQNLEAYSNEGLKLISLQPGIIQQIRKQQNAYDNNTYKSDSGRQVYEFLTDATFNEACEKLFSLLMEIEVKPQPKPQKRHIPESSEYPTDPALREAAVLNAGYKCEYENSHTSFVCKSTMEQYMEGHHLIPIGKQDEFNTRLDNIINIFSLCPNCHKMVHYGVAEAKRPILEKLFNSRKAGLQKLIPGIDLKQLLTLYDKMEELIITE